MIDFLSVFGIIDLLFLRLFLLFLSACVFVCRFVFHLGFEFGEVLVMLSGFCVLFASCFMCVTVLSFSIYVVVVLCLFFACLLCVCVCLL